jgi:hypothetical protein
VPSERSCEVRDIGGALAHLWEAEALPQELGLPGELWQIRAELGELYDERGDEESLAGRIDDPTLQASCLEPPQVRRVLER